MICLRCYKALAVSELLMVVCNVILSHSEAAHHLFIVLYTRAVEAFREE